MKSLKLISKKLNYLLCLVFILSQVICQGSNIHLSPNSRLLKESLKYREFSIIQPIIKFHKIDEVKVQNFYISGDYDKPWVFIKIDGKIRVFNLLSKSEIHYVLDHYSENELAKFTSYTKSSSELTLEEINLIRALNQVLQPDLLDKSMQPKVWSKAEIENITKMSFSKLSKIIENYPGHWLFYITPIQNDINKFHIRGAGGVSSYNNNHFRNLDNKWKKIISIGVGVLLIVSLVMGYFYYDSLKKNDFWIKSTSKQNIEMLISVYETGDKELALKISEAAHARGKRMQKRIDEALDGIVNWNDDKEFDIPKAKKYVVFDHAAEGLAELTQNRIEDDIKLRIGKIKPATWKNTLTEKENEAVFYGENGEWNSEKYLFIELNKLREELNHEISHHVRELENDFKSFRKECPSLFGKTMLDDAKIFDSALEIFKKDEIAPEQTMLNITTKNMRLRVSNKLYDNRDPSLADPTFYQHRDYKDQLKNLKDDNIIPLVSIAKEVDNRLQSMISNRTTETAMLALAVMHEDDEECETTTDSNGNTTITCTPVDNSGPYKLMAATAASNAESDAAAAMDGIEKINKIMPQLLKDSFFTSERLNEMLPWSTKDVSVSEGWGWGFDVFLPGLISMIGSISSIADGNSARTEFAPLLNALIEIQNTVEQRHHKENSWIESKITEDLLNQAKTLSKQFDITTISSIDEFNKANENNQSSPEEYVNPESEFFVPIDSIQNPLRIKDVKESRIDNSVTIIYEDDSKEVIPISEFQKRVNSGDLLPHNGENLKAA